MDPMRLTFRVAALRKLAEKPSSAAATAAGVPPETVRSGRDNTFAHVRLLEANKGSCSASAANDVAETAGQLAHMAATSGGLPLTAPDAEFLLFAIQCNAHSVVNDTGAAVGLGLFPLTSMLNHSCRPNCVHQFLCTPGRPPRLVMRAVAAVAPGEELVYSYVALYQSTRARTEQLFRAYSFHCDCPRCVAADDDAIDADGGASDVVAARVGRLAAPPVDLPALLDALGGPEIGPLGPAHRALVQCYHAIARHAHSSGSGDEDEAVLRAGAGYGLLALGCMRTHVPEAQPEVGTLQGHVADVIGRWLRLGGHPPPPPPPPQQPASSSSSSSTAADEGAGDDDALAAAAVAAMAGFHFATDPRTTALLRRAVYLPTTLTSGSEGADKSTTQLPAPPPSGGSQGSDALRAAAKVLRASSQRIHTICRRQV
jgi:hypothetical protein